MTIDKAFEDTRTISATSRDNLTKEVDKFITDSVANYGGEVSAQHDRLVTKICDELYAKYGALRIAEVEYIIDNGTKGVYGDNFSASVKNFLRWTNAYLLSDEHGIKQREWDRQHRNQKIDYDGALAAKNEQSLWDLVLRYYNQVNNGGMIDGIPYNVARVFDFLRDRGLKLAETKAEEKQIMLSALEEAKRPRKAVQGLVPIDKAIYFCWDSFDEVTRAKTLICDRLMRRNMQEVYNILMHRQ